MKRFLAGCLVLLALASIGIFATQVLLGKLISKPRLIALVRAHTGDTLSFDQMRVSTFPQVGLTLTNVTLTAPTSSGDNVPLLQAKVAHVSASIMPLFRRSLQLRHFELEDGRINLIRDASGVANWVFQPRRAEGNKASPPSPERKKTSHDHLHLNGVVLRRMNVSFKDAVTRRTGEVFMQEARVEGVTSGSPHIEIQARHNDTEFSVSGHVGSLEDFANPHRPWHIGLGLILGSGERKDGWIDFSGSLRDPENLQGWSGEIKVKLRRVSQLRALLPRARIPDIGGLSGRIEFRDNFYDIIPGTDQRSRWYQTLQFDMIDLDIGRFTDASGLGGKDISLSARHAHDAVKFAATIPVKDRNWSVQATVPSLEDLNQALKSDFGKPFSLSARLAPSTQRLAFFDRDGVVHVNGQVSRPHTQFDIDGRVHHLPIGPLLLEDAVFDAQADVNGRDVDIRNLKLRSRTLSLQGHGSLRMARMPETKGRINADLDITYADMMGLKQAGEIRHWSLPLEIAIPIPPALPQKEGTDQAPPKPEYGVSNRAPGMTFLRNLSLVGLRDFDWSITAKGDGLKFGDRTCNSVKLDAHYMDGRLDAAIEKDDPAEGHLRGSAAYDAHAELPELTLRADPIVLPAKLLARYFGIEPVADGPVEIVGNVAGPVESKSMFLKKMHGHVGLSMTGGVIRPSALRAYLRNGIGSLLKAHELPLRCLGIHAAVTPELINVDALGVEADPISVTGSGQFDRAQNRLAFHLNPVITIAKAGASTPLFVGGSPEKPIVLQQRGDDGRVGLKIGHVEGDLCPALLVKAREGMPGSNVAPPRKKVSAMGLLESLGIFR